MRTVMPQAGAALQNAMSCFPGPPTWKVSITAAIWMARMACLHLTTGMGGRRCSEDSSRNYLLRTSSYSSAGATVRALDRGHHAHSSAAVRMMPKGRAAGRANTMAPFTTIVSTNARHAQ